MHAISYASAPFAIMTAGLTRRFGTRTAVRDLTLRVPVGCVYGFLGPNGAGKTTTMRLLVGLLRPDAGSVRLLSHDLHTDRLAALAQVGAFIETPALYDHLSGRTNLDLTRSLLSLPRSEVDRVLELVDMRDAADRRVGGYSLGMKQRLALARSLLGSPRLLLLDEPTNGLDPDGIIAMRALIRALPERIGGTVLMSSHLLNEVEQTATVAGLMNAGRLVLQGDVRSLTGGAGIVRIELDDAARGAAVLVTDGAKIVETGESVLRVQLSTAGEAPDRVARFNRLLTEAGIGVSGLMRETRSLEQVYRDAVANHGRGLAA